MNLRVQDSMTGTWAPAPPQSARQLLAPVKTMWLAIVMQPHRISIVTELESNNPAPPLHKSTATLLRLWSTFWKRYSKLHI